MAAKKIGDWDKVRMLIFRLGDECEQAQQISLKRFGLKAEGLAKAHISNQDLGWNSLNPEYLARKIRKGYSENILVKTSSYFQSITSYVVGDTVYAGVKKIVKDKNGVEIANIARIHEFGSLSSGIPARPLWRPTLEETVTWHNQKNRPELILMQRLKKYL